MNDRLPFLKIYPGDFYRSDVPGLPIEAQWLYFRMIVLMHDAERVGYLSVNGSPIPPESIVRKIGAITLEQYESLLGVLLASSIFESAPDGTIFSKEMVAAERRRKQASRSGKLGGNPALAGSGEVDGNAGEKSGVRVPLKGTLKAPLKAPPKPKSYSDSEKREEESVPDSPADSCESAPVCSRAREGGADGQFGILAVIWREEVGSGLPCPLFSNDKRAAAAKRLFSGYKAEADLAQLLDQWRSACRKVAASSFCLGMGGRGWRATIDWLMKPDVLVRVLEGAYDDGGKTADTSSGGIGSGARDGPRSGCAPNARLGSGNAIPRL